MANLTDKVVSKTAFEYALGELPKIFANKDEFSALQTQVQGIVATGGEENIINAITLNGTAVTITDKTANIVVSNPDMSAYSTTEQMNSAIATAISETSHISRSIVDTLPQSGDEKIIYMVTNGKDGNNSYDEYMWINDGFELVGSSDIDLSGYLQTSDIELMSVAEVREILYPTTNP